MLADRGRCNDLRVTNTGNQNDRTEQPRAAPVRSPLMPATP
jgi:hypothetical protein